MVWNEREGLRRPFRKPSAGMVCMATMAVSGWGVEKDCAVANDWLDRALDAADPGNTYVTDRVNYLRDWMANN